MENIFIIKIFAGACDPSCVQYEDVCGVCVPPRTCPARCAAAADSGDCDPSCDEFADVCGPCIPVCPQRCEVT